MPNDGEADRSVRIVGANAQADESVFVVNNLVVAGSPSPGDVPVVQGDGSLAWGAGDGGGGGSPVYWVGFALGVNKIVLADILASHQIVWTESQNVGGFALSLDGKTLTLPAGTLFVLVVHISEYDNSDGVMVASIGGTGLIGGGNSAALTPLVGDDFGEDEMTMLCGGGAAVGVQAGFGTLTPTKGSFTATLTVHKIG